MRVILEDRWKEATKVEVVKSFEEYDAARLVGGHFLVIEFNVIL